MKQSNMGSALKSAITVLATAGAMISVWQTRLFYLTRSGMGDMHSFCNIGQTFDCTAVEMSPYAELLKGVPLSGVASAGYFIILILALCAFNEELKSSTRKYLLAFSGVAVAFSIVYLGIMLFVIKKLCLLCLGVDAINLALLFLAFRLPKEQETSSAFSLKHLTYAGLGSLFLSFLVMKAADPQAEMKREDLNDLIESVYATPAIEVKIPADAPFVGDPNAKVTIVKFSDYECPACKMGATAIHPLFKRYPSGVKFAFVNFPLAMECNPSAGLKRTMHEFACEAAAVAVCATEQGKFIETYEALFENQAEFKTGNIAELVSKKVQGLDLKKLSECVTLPSTAEKIKADANLGVALKVQSTPTFFINGKRVEGGLPTNLWVELIDRMLK